MLKMNSQWATRRRISTAAGIDDDAWLGCSGGPVDSAPTTGCGDYVQTAGVTTFGKGEIAAFFYVNIADDPRESAGTSNFQQRCRARPPCRASEFLARLRIDDDDFRSWRARLCPDTGFKADSPWFMCFVPVDPSGISRPRSPRARRQSALVCLKTLASKHKLPRLELKTGVCQLVKRRAESFA